MQKSDQKLAAFYLVVDFILLNFSIITVLFFKYGFREVGQYYYLFFVIYNLLWLLVVSINNSYNLFFRNNLSERLFVQLKNFAIFIAIVSIVLTFFKGPEFSRTVIYGSILIFFLVKFIVRYYLFKIVGYLRHRGKNLRHIMLIGAGRIGHQLFNYLNENIDLGYHLVGALDDNHVNGPLSKYIMGKVDELEKAINNKRPDEIIIALPITASGKIKKAVEITDHHGIRVWTGAGLL